MIYITEVGSNSAGWSWTKYSNGMVELTLKTSVSCTYEYTDGAGRYSAYVYIPLPFSLNSSKNYATVKANCGNLFYITSTGFNSTNFYFRVCKHASWSGTVSNTVMIKVRGYAL